ncbi:signal recognition particle 54 kDa protein 2-like [Ricinus communis]|uniref:signal recognition particle 54 kDa protein 2-like n=1 Tax=Ricinus communis TaxID=3988 RepID=UPI00201B2698|nr:signal recognition particle 54 kDa protein 2-like [Ricinus communis]
MALAELGGSMSRAIQQMNNASIIDLCLNEIALSLFQSDVQFNLVRKMQVNIKKFIHNNHYFAAGYDKPYIIQHAIFNELCKLLDPGEPSFINSSASGKTTACTQFAYFYKKKGWRPAIVYADAFRASNFDQLMKNAIEATIPRYGSFMESHPVKAVQKCIKRNSDLIIIDTTERHTEVASLLKEMRQVSETTVFLLLQVCDLVDLWTFISFIGAEIFYIVQKLDLLVFVMDKLHLNKLRHLSKVLKLGW